MVNKKRLIELFTDLVQIDSPSFKEREMADELKKMLKELGGQVKEDNTGEKIGGNAGNIIADFPGQEGYPHLLLSAHMDRVEPGQGIKPVIKGDYITSSGDTILGGDDIIGVVAILETIRILKDNGISHGPLKVIFSVAEEVGLKGAKNVDTTEILSADYGIVYDVDGEVGTIVYKAPSQVKINVKVKGRAAHAGMHPGEGINAIKIASKAISDMRLGQVDEETTANIGVIKGGKAINIIPDLVELEGEARSQREELLKKQVEHIKDVFKNSAEKYGGNIEFNVEHLYTRFELERDCAIIKLVAKSAEKLGLPVSYNISGGGSDANIYNEVGLPTVNLGTGMEKVHSTEERVKIDSLVNLVKLNIKIIEDSKRFREDV